MYNVHDYIISGIQSAPTATSQTDTTSLDRVKIKQCKLILYRVHTCICIHVCTGCSGSSVGRALAMRAWFESHLVQLIFSMAVPGVGFHYLLCLVSGFPLLASQ